MRDLIRKQEEADRTVKAWVDALGERPEGRTALFLIETLRTMVLTTMADLSKREEPASTEELARLALTLKRIEGYRQAPRGPGAGGEEGGAGRRPGQAPGRALVGNRRHDPRGGGGRPALAAPTAAHRHIGAVGPVESGESRPSSLIPPDPGESAPKPIPANPGRKLCRGCFAPGPHRSCPSGRSEARVVV